MKWKCNTFDCQKEFDLDITETDVEKSQFIVPMCPYCKEPNNRSYRI